MRRETSTVVALVGEVSDRVLAELERSPNVSVARGPVEATGQQSGQHTQPRPAWETGALAMREAARLRSPYVIVTADPLADVAAAWRHMWDEAGGPELSAVFEVSAAEALAAWRGKQFELPDYYLLIAGEQAEGTGPDLYLGPLRAARPHRVAADIARGPAQVSRVLDTLRSLPHGPWWPPLDQLIDAIRAFYAGGLAETQPGPGQPPG
jgi:hypothetical protein